MATRRVDAPFGRNSVANPMYDPHGEAHTPTTDERLALVLQQLLPHALATPSKVSTENSELARPLVLTNSTISLERVFVLLTDRD